VESLRRLSFSIEPTPTLDAMALLVSAAPPVAGRVALVDPRLVRAVTRALDPHAALLARFVTLSAWLARHDHARITPAASGRRAVTPPWRARVDVTLNLRALARGLAAEGGRVDGPHHTALFAARALLQASAAGPLWIVTSLRAGSQEVTTTEALRALEALARDSALRDGAMPRRFDPNRPPRVARVATPEEAPPTPAPPIAPVAKPPTARTKPATKAPPTPVEAPPTPAAPSARVRARRRTAEAPPSAQGGFGGLPDDATSELPPTPRPEPRSARGLGLDAEFFLEVAELHAWPCAQPVLHAARRRVIARLHPDHAGDHAGREFHRALKGFAELLPLCAHDAPAPTPVPVPTPVAAPPPARPRYQEWPPPAAHVAPAPAPTSTAPVAEARAPRRTATRSR
jgi:hypothetical protein